MSENQNKSIALTADDLKEIIATAIAAAKAPNAVEQDKLDRLKQEIILANQNREKLGKQVLQDIANKRLTQMLCSHEHRNGDSHGVYIMEKNSPGYILCQMCQGKVRPGQAPDKYAGVDIFSTPLFNKMFQKLPGSEMFG